MFYHGILQQVSERDSSYQASDGSATKFWTGLVHIPDYTPLRDQSGKQLNKGGLNMATNDAEARRPVLEDRGSLVTIRIPEELGQALSQLLAQQPKPVIRLGLYSPSPCPFRAILLPAKDNHPARAILQMSVESIHLDAVTMLKLTQAQQPQPQPQAQAPAPTPKPKAKVVRKEEPTDF